MTVTLIALDYSGPVQTLFKQAPRAGAVHSIFQRAMNIALDETIVAVLSSELQRMPNALRLSPPVARELLSEVHLGMQIQIGAGKLRIPSRDVVIHLPEQPPWEPRPHLAAYHWHREIVALHGRSLAGHLSRVSRRDGLAPLVWPLLLQQPTKETPLTRVALPWLRSLAYASRELDVAGVEEAARHLAGLGPGLTPSGDDALAGFASVMALLSPYLSGDALPRISIASAIATAAMPRTHALSAVLLQHAARGEVAEHVGALFTALALRAEASEAVLHAADELLAFGGTSGGDMLLGLLLGLRALDETHSLPPGDSEPAKAEPCFWMNEKHTLPAREGALP